MPKNSASAPKGTLPTAPVFDWSLQMPTQEERAVEDAIAQEWAAAFNTVYASEARYSPFLARMLKRKNSARGGKGR